MPEFNLYSTGLKINRYRHTRLNEEQGIMSVILCCFWFVMSMIGIQSDEKQLNVKNGRVVSTVIFTRVVTNRDEIVLQNKMSSSNTVHTDCWVLWQIKNNTFPFLPIVIVETSQSRATGNKRFHGDSAWSIGSDEEKSLHTKIRLA